MSEYSIFLIKYAGLYRVPLRMKIPNNKGRKMIKIKTPHFLKKRNNKEYWSFPLFFVEKKKFVCEDNLF